MSHRAINDIGMNGNSQEGKAFFLLLSLFVFNYSWQLIVFDKKQKRCVKRIHLVTDDGLYDQKAFYTAKIVFYSFSMNDGEFMNYKQLVFMPKYLSYF